MHWRMPFLLLLLLPLSGTVMNSAPQNAAQRSNPVEDDRGTIGWRVRQAKANGRLHIEVPAPAGITAHVRSLSEALGYYTVLLVRPVASVVTVPDNYGIVTWWKLTVISRFNVRPLAEFDPEPIPTELLPLRVNEILISQHGGTVEIDGVTVVSTDKSFPLLSSQRTYVLFLRLNPSGNIGWVQLGSDGVFEVTADGHVRPLTSKPTPLREDIQLLTSGSFDGLQTEIKNRASTQ